MKKSRKRERGGRFVLQVWLGRPWQGTVTNPLKREENLPLCPPSLPSCAPPAPPATRLWEATEWAARAVLQALVGEVNRASQGQLVSALVLQMLPPWLL